MVNVVPYARAIDMTGLVTVEPSMLTGLTRIARRQSLPVLILLYCRAEPVRRSRSCFQLLARPSARQSLHEPLNYFELYPTGLLICPLLAAH